MVWAVLELWCQAQDMANEMVSVASWSLQIGLINHSPFCSY
jgi:hypothetical protein